MALCEFQFLGFSTTKDGLKKAARRGEFQEEIRIQTARTSSKKKWKKLDSPWRCASPNSWDNAHPNLEQS